MQLIPHLPKRLQPPPFVKSPALIGLWKKSSVLTKDEEDKAVDRAAKAAQFCDLPMPVIEKRQQIGWVLGKQLSSDVLFLPGRRSLHQIEAAGFPSYDAIISAITTNGRRYSAIWSKGATTAGVANNWYDLWPVAGNPVAGTYAGSASSSLQFTDASTGALAHFGNVSTFTKHILSVWGVASAGVPPPILMLYDRCVTYENVPFNNAAANTFTQSNSPVSLRYSTGSDSGNKIIVTCQTVESATQQSFTVLTYVNQAGSTGVAAPCSTTTTNIIVSAATPTATLGARVVSPCATAAGTLVTSPFMPLAVGDVGVQSITNMTTSAATINTGKLCFVMGRPLAFLPLATAGVASLVDTVMMVAALERVFDGACLTFLAMFPVATGATLTGSVDVGWN